MKISFAALLAAGSLAILLGACAQEGAAPPRAASATTTAASSLDGRTFDVVGEVPAGSNLPSKIDVEFTGGQLDSSACRAQGLSPIPYTVQADGRFYAERRTGGDLDTWAGHVTGDRIEGTFVAMKGGTTVTRIPFRGQLR